MRIEAKDICKRYFRRSGEANAFYAVQPMSIALEPERVTVLMGRSGSGKTTLLNMLAGLLAPDTGSILADDTNLYALSDRALSAFRNRALAVIPQGRSAVDSLTVLENVCLPGMLYGKSAREEEAMAWLQALGIDSLRDVRPAELSGGELRRMAIARAMLQDTDVLFADEPTGDLDDENTRLVLSMFQRAAKERGKCVLLVTHEQDALPYADNVYVMNAGELTGET